MDNEQLYLHIRVVLGILLGLGITKLLSGITLLIEKPTRYRWSWLHMSWVVWVLLSIVTFWWWEAGLTQVRHWTFGTYLFVIAYASLYYVLATFLFPGDVGEHGSYEGYLMHRRGAFFGLIAAITLIDLVDTAIKGNSRWHLLGEAYAIHAVLMLLIALIGWRAKNPRVQVLLAGIALLYLVGYYVIQYVLAA